MDDYVLLLNQVTPYLNSRFSEIPQNIQERISQAGMGGKTESCFDGIEEFEWAHIEAKNKYLSYAEVREIEEGEGIRKGKGIRIKTKTKQCYIWDTLSPIKREYEVSRYDFHNCPGHKENVALEKLAKTITPYLHLDYSKLPQEMKMNIAFADGFQLWDELTPEQRQNMAEEFDAKMRPDYAEIVNEYCQLALERLSIPDLIFYWQRLNPNGIASEQIKIDDKIKEIRRREAELNELLGYSNSNKTQESKQPQSIGRPRSVEEKTKILKQLIEILTAGENISPANLPGSADNLKEACSRIANAKSKRNIFNISLSTFKVWLKTTGYGFGNGRTRSDEDAYWTKLCVKNIGNIPKSIFTENSGKSMPQPAPAKGIQRKET